MSTTGPTRTELHLAGWMAQVFRQPGGDCGLSWVPGDSSWEPRWGSEWRPF